MGRKRRDMSFLKAFCYYCDKIFKNQVVLHQHQKAKHFTCTKCAKKFSSIDSMLQHFKTAHGQSVQRVPNANQGRENVALKIFGMQGVPRMDIQAWILKGAQKYWSKIIEEKNERLRNEKKLKEKKQKQQEAQNLTKQQPKQKIQEEQPQIELNFPISFQLKR